MEAPLFNYWNYITPAYQAPVYELPPDVSEVPSLSASPVSVMNDQFPTPAQPNFMPLVTEEPTHFGAYPVSMSTSDFESERSSPQCSPNPALPIEAAFAPMQESTPAERPHATSGRRRAQNRAAQRAFRERKEKHARDLESQLSVMNDKYIKLEASHTELNVAYQKLRKTVELLTHDDSDAEAEDENGQAVPRRNGSGSSETLRKLLEILHGEFKAASPVKMEEM